MNRSKLCLKQLCDEQVHEARKRKLKEDPEYASKVHRLAKEVEALIYEKAADIAMHLVMNKAHCLLVSGDSVEGVDPTEVYLRTDLAEGRYFETQESHRHGEVQASEDSGESDTGSSTGDKVLNSKKSPRH